MSTVAHLGSLATTHRTSFFDSSPANFQLEDPHASIRAAEAVQGRNSAGSTHRDLPPAVRELAQEIDRYKFRHRRRFISYEEILSVVKTLGYRKKFDDRSHIST